MLYSSTLFPSPVFQTAPTSAGTPTKPNFIGKRLVLLSDTSLTTLCPTKHRLNFSTAPSTTFPTDISACLFPSSLPALSDPFSHPQQQFTSTSRDVKVAFRTVCTGNVWPDTSICRGRAIAPPLTKTLLLSTTLSSASASASTSAPDPAPGPIPSIESVDGPSVRTSVESLEIES